MCSFMNERASLVLNFIEKLSGALSHSTDMAQHEIIPVERKQKQTKQMEANQAKQCTIHTFLSVCLSHIDSTCHHPIHVNVVKHVGPCDLWVFCHYFLICSCFKCLWIKKTMWLATMTILLSWNWSRNLMMMVKISWKYWNLWKTHFLKSERRRKHQHCHTKLFSFDHGAKFTKINRFSPSNWKVTWPWRYVKACWLFTHKVCWEKDRWNDICKSCQK